MWSSCLILGYGASQRRRSHVVVSARGSTAAASDGGSGGCVGGCYCSIIAGLLSSSSISEQRCDGDGILAEGRSMAPRLASVERCTAREKTRTSEVCKAAAVPYERAKTQIALPPHWVAPAFTIVALHLDVFGARTLCRLETETALALQHRSQRARARLLQQQPCNRYSSSPCSM